MLAEYNMVCCCGALQVRHMYMVSIPVLVGAIKHLTARLFGFVYQSNTSSLSTGMITHRRDNLKRKGRGLGQHTARTGTGLVRWYSHANAREIATDTLGVTPPGRSRASITAHTGTESGEVDRVLA